MKWRLSLLLLLTSSVSLSILAANDQTLQSGATLVRIQIVKGCLLNNVATGNASLGSLNFGEIYKTNSLKDGVTVTGNGSILLRCTPGTTAKITMGPGLHGTGINNRRMRLVSGASTLTYQLYTSSDRLTVWDNIQGVSVVFSDDATKTFPVYGRVPAQTTPPSGQYSDQILVTVSY
jgi:spore coat protein U-like protein